MADAEESGYGLRLRTPTYFWARPVLGITLLALWMLLFAGIVLLPVLAITVALDHHGAFSTALDAALQQDHVTWQSALYLNLLLASLTLVVWGLLRYLHGVRPREIASARPGFRWKFFAACLGLSVVAIIAQLVVGTWLPDDPNGTNGSVNDLTSSLVAIGVVVVLTTPLQAIGEEWAFRGYLLQAFSALTRRPWIGLVVGALLFACAHGVQNAPLFLDRLTFGLMAGYLALRTRGLEAGIALHIWNNLIAFGLALVIGDIDETLKVSEVPWSYVVLPITQDGIYLLLVLWIANRMGITSRTDGPVLAPRTSPV